MTVIMYLLKYIFVCEVKNFNVNYNTTALWNNNCDVFFYENSFIKLGFEDGNENGSLIKIM